MFAIDWLKLFSPRNIAAVIIFAILAYGAYSGYNWIYDRGAASRDKEVAGLTAERDEARQELKEYKDAYNKWKADADKARETAERESAKIIADLERKLDQANKRKTEREVIIHEVEKYVPASVDAHFRLPAGAVWMYSATLQGPAAASRDLGAVPQGDYGDAHPASPFTMSDFASRFGQNNLECVRRGEVIQWWQEWYERNAPLFERWREYVEVSSKRVEGK